MLPADRLPIRACLAALLCWPAGASDAAEDSAARPSDRVEEVVVVARTGSRIKRHADSPSPLAGFDGEALTDAAAKDLRDLVGLLPINNGAENNSDNLTQNYTAGTANVNLRGLGVASTLVLLNGKRQVFSAVQTDDGSSFVDLAALVPMLALDRVEILKDGASAIYGSDAVAGVANFVTKRDYQGAEIRLEYRTRTNGGSQDDLTVDGVAGSSLGAAGSVLFAASYLNRSSLLLEEVDWLRPSTSGFGNPASFNVPSLGRTVADPACDAAGGLFQALANGSTICRFDYAPQLTAVPVEDRLQGYARATWEIAPNAMLWAEIGYAKNDISREVSPSFPVLNTPLVPATHPQNPYGEDVFFQGRVYGVGHPPEVNYYRHGTLRAALGAQGGLGETASWEVSYARAANDAVLNPRDTVQARLQAALLGFGGRECDAGTGRPGEGACRFFNPFGSAIGALPGAPGYNDPALRDFIIGDYFGDARSELQVLEANFTGFFGELAGGPVGFAAGAQLRRKSIAAAYDPVTRQDGFAFLIGNADFNGETTVVAAYGELLLPLSPRVEATGALRFEDYGGGVGDTLDPKVAVLISATPTLALRASAGTSFRAPTTFQRHGAQTNFVNIRDYDGSTTFAGRRTLGDPNLQPENATAFHMGATWEPMGLLQLDLDYWRYSFEDVLRKENAQAIVDADPFDPRVRRTPAGTVAIVHAAFINADAIDASGVDFQARGHFHANWGAVSPFVEATWMLAYDATNDGRRVNGLGRLNRANVGAPNQRFKASAGVGWKRGAAAANLQLRHVGRYEDDRGAGIDSFTTFDVNVEYRFRSWRTVVRLGVLNLTDEAPPYVDVGGNYDVRSADPRGRRAFVQLAYVSGEALGE